MQTLAIQNWGATNTVRIEAMSAQGTIGSWVVDKKVIAIGRSAVADVVLPANKKISRVHCQLEVRPDGIYVKDAGSRLGTWLNGRRVSEALILPEDMVVVAGIRLRAKLLDGFS